MLTKLKSSRSERFASPLAGTGAALAVAAVVAAAMVSSLLGRSRIQTDGLSIAVAGLTVFITAIVAAFCTRYMRADARPGRFFATGGLLVLSILGFVLTDSVPAFAAAWWASGWLLARMIGHSGGWSEAESAARRARATFALGDVAMIAALALLGWQAQSAELGTVLARASTLPAPIAYAVALLLLVAAATRCALPPFSGWLLSSMTAPTPVSALMHAGFVNAGGFLLIRFAPVMEAAPAVRVAAILLGLSAALYGLGIMAVRPDIKRSLAGSTISQMGFMIMSCGLGAYAAALWHIVGHALFKGWLFLGVGSAVGIIPRVSTTRGEGRAATGIAVATLAAGLLLAWRGIAAGGMIPLLLAAATATATMAGTVRRLEPRSALWIAVIILVLVALQGAGLAAADALRSDGPALLPPLALVALLATFIGTWLWQGRRLAEGMHLPPALYIRLLNAGALRPAQGEAK